MSCAWSIARPVAFTVAIAFALQCATTVAHSAEIDFSKQIAPLLRQHCQKCHGANKQQGGLRFDDRKGALAKGDSGQLAIVSGNPAASELIRRISSADEAEWMPPEGDRLTKAEIDLLRAWIAAGAAWPENDSSVAAVGELIVSEEDRRHWSFLSLESPAVPEVEPASRSGSEIDRFIITALTHRELSLSKPAAPGTLVRRIYFDLVGLPPSPEEIAAFAEAAVVDRRAATAALIDRLLASEHYGERWARHWLDVVRYADSNGQEGDQDRPYAYQYRDFVIKAFNNDLPFDQFVRWQLAGDELEPDNPLAVAATGFWVAGPHTVLNVPMEEEKIRNRYNELDDMLSTLGSGLLGLSLGCARCHDHKYDAIPTRDYYRLLCAVQSGDRHDAFVGPRSEVAALEASHADWQQKLTEAESQLNKWLKGVRRPLDQKIREEKIADLPLPDDEKTLLRDMPESPPARNLAKKHAKALAISDAELRKLMSAEDGGHWDKLKKRVQEIRHAEPTGFERALIFRETSSTPKPSWLFRRADFYDKSQPVQLGFLSVLTTSKSPDVYRDEAISTGDRQDTTYQRAALANWITDIEQGAGALLARVIVNRVWRHHFGEGLVRTPSDFGVQGEKPSHPELLEWLAQDFVRHGWRFKRLHRQIMLSDVYLQDCAFDAANAKIDPDNRLLWRRVPLRLEAEILRDAMLVAAGTLNRQRFGPGFKPPIPAEAMVARNLKTAYNPEPSDSPNVRRRSVYMFHKRVVPDPLLQAFDRPDALQSCGRRDTTTVAPQALALLNDPFVRQRAEEFAGRILSAAGHSDLARVEHAFWIALGRAPQQLEQQAAIAFVSAQRDTRRERRRDKSEASANEAAWADFCQTLFGLNEFLYVD